MSEFIFEFIQANPRLILAMLALLISTLGVGITLKVRKTNAENRFYDKLEADSLYQIDQNVKDIERILNDPIYDGDNLNKNTTLNAILDEAHNMDAVSGIDAALGKLSCYFAEYCANLDKYNSNIMPRKMVCMVYQEHGRRARRLLELFEKSKYKDISLEFAKLHLSQADISY
jgi:hypothetical protein